MEKSEPWPEDLVSMPISPEASPAMSSLPYRQQSNHDFGQVSNSVISSTVSTPVFSSDRTAGYSNNYGYLSTSGLSTPSGTPIKCLATHPEIPPLLELNNNLCGSTFPKRISCSINMAQAQAGSPHVSEKTLSMSPASFHSLKNQQKSTMNCISFTQAVENIDKKALQSNEEERMYPGSCKYDPYLVDGASNLFITWAGSKADLVKRLKCFRLEVRDVYRTNDENISNVVFLSHRVARKAFTYQHEIRLRMVPPRNSRLN